MIRTAELHGLAARQGLRFNQAEKNYIILWLLSGLVRCGEKEHGLISRVVHV